MEDGGTLHRGRHRRRDRRFAKRYLQPELNLRRDSRIKGFGVKIAEAFSYEQIDSSFNSLRFAARPAIHSLRWNLHRFEDE